jgi:hypothetical protein
VCVYDGYAPVKSLGCGVDEAWVAYIGTPFSHAWDSAACRATAAPDCVSVGSEMVASTLEVMFLSVWWRLRVGSKALYQTAVLTIVSEWRTNDTSQPRSS